MQGIEGSSRGDQGSLCCGVVSVYPQWPGAQLTFPIPFAVCPPSGLLEEPLKKGAGKCSPPKGEAQDTQARKPAQEMLPAQGHGPCSTQNGLTPSPNNMQRLLSPVCLLVFPRCLNGLT